MMVVLKQKPPHKAMKIKNLSLITGVFALSLSIIPLVAKANTTLHTPLQIAQTSPHHGKGKLFASLGLSDQQKVDIKQIRQSTRERRQQIISPEQEQAFKTAIQNHQGFKAAREAMNLTDQQKCDLKQLMQSSREQIKAVLTPEQQMQLEQIRQQWRANHSQSSS